MIAYLDASAIVKVLRPEDASAEAVAICEGENRIVTSSIAQVEVVCAVRAICERRRDGSTIDRAVADGSFVRDRADAIAADDRIIALARALGVRHRLRALDAIHVASALDLAEARPVFVSWDRDQRRAAAAEGLALFPA